MWLNAMGLVIAPGRLLFILAGCFFTVMWHPPLVYLLCSSQQANFHAFLWGCTVRRFFAASSACKQHALSSFKSRPGPILRGLEPCRDLYMYYYIIWHVFVLYIIYYYMWVLLLTATYLPAFRVCATMFVLGPRAVCGPPEYSALELNPK